MGLIQKSMQKQVNQISPDEILFFHETLSSIKFRLEEHGVFTSYFIRPK